jgi:hypothetical protein
MVKGTCKICGKEEILNENGECYDCYDLNSYVRKKIGKRENERFSSLGQNKKYILMILVNNIVSMIMMLIVCAIFYYFDEGEFWGTDKAMAVFGYFFGMLYGDYLRLSDLKGHTGFQWKEPLINLAVKIPTMFVPIHILEWIIINWEFKYIYKKYNSDLKSLHMLEFNAVLNNLYYDETDGLADIGTIPETDIPKWEISHETLGLALKNAKSSIDKLSATEEQKRKIYDLMRCSDEELYMDNDINYLYCGAVVDLLENHLQKIDVNEYFPFLDQYYEIAYGGSERTYVTKPIFEMSQRLRKEFVEPFNNYHELLDEKKELIKDVNADYAILMTGHVGEERVETALKPYEGQIIAIPNLRIEVEGNSIESDFVIVSPYGVYVLEVKNLGNKNQYGLHIAKDGRWTKTYGENEEVTNSPVEQNERHILYLEKYINQALGRELDERIRVQGMVVIANDNVDIQNETDDIVVRYGNIMNTIRKKPVIMKEAEMKVIAEVLKSAGLETKLHTLSYCKNPFWQVYLQLFNAEKMFREWEENVKPLQQYVDDFIENRFISEDSCPHYEDYAVKKGWQKPSSDDWIFNTY